MLGFLSRKRKRKGTLKNIRIGATALPGFDAQFYLANNPDVRDSGIDPLVHFLEHGWKEGRDPSRGFSVINYLQNNPDVRDAGLNPLMHFLEFGLAEGRNLRLPPASFSQSEHDPNRQLVVRPASEMDDGASTDDERLALQRLWARPGAEQKMRKTSLIFSYDPPETQSER